MMRHKKCKHYDSSKKTKLLIKRNYIVFVLIVIVSVIVIRKIQDIYAYFTDFVTMPNQFSIEAEYIVEFDSNTGIGTMENQKISYNVLTNLNPNTFSKPNYVFSGWNTEKDGTGTEFFDKQAVRDIGNIKLYAQWLNADSVAEIDGTYYSSLQDAVDAVPTDNTETRIILLQNTSEFITVSAKKNIIFDFRNSTLSNDGNNNVISNDGTIKFISGSIVSSASFGAVNNNSGATLIMTGGKIIATGSRQAIYNVNGTVEISGNAYLSATTNQRSTVQNMTSGTLIITGGTIVSTGSSAINNSASMTIGIKDGDVDSTSPIIRGITNGISTTSDFNFYDGIIEGKKDAINDISKLQDKEDDYLVANSTETVDGVVYKTIYLGERCTISFNPNGGSVDESTRTVAYGEVIGALPTATRSDYLFEGWYTDVDGKNEITANAIIKGDLTLYARWADTNAAEISGIKYETIHEAVAAVPTDGTQTTIKVLRNLNIDERITITSNKNIILDIQNNIIRNSDPTIPIIENSGVLTLISGTIKSSATQGAINNYKGGVLNVVGGSIIATGTRQAIYNNGGTVEISGTAKISASSSERAAVQNNSGTMYITGGKIVSSGFSAVVNYANMTIGIEDGEVDSTLPVIEGITYGVTNTKTLNFYDGILKGITDSISGSITNIESNCTRVNSTEIIDEITYKTTYLQ